MLKTLSKDFPIKIFRREKKKNMKILHRFVKLSHLLISDTHLFQPTDGGKRKKKTTQHTRTHTHTQKNCGQKLMHHCMLQNAQPVEGYWGEKRKSAAGGPKMAV